MPWSKFIIIPLFITLQAFLLMLISPFVPFTSKEVAAVAGHGLLVWVAFQAWAVYFMGGGSVKMGVKSVIGYAGGIAASICIFKAAAFLDPFLTIGGTPFGLYLIVGVVAGLLVCLGRFPTIDFVPAYFVGAGVFFALTGYLKAPANLDQFTWWLKLAAPEMTACVVGLAFGWGSVTFQTWYEGKVAREAAQTEVDAKAVCRAEAETGSRP